MVTWDRLGRGQPVPPDQEFQIVCWLRDGSWFRNRFRTDAAGYAEVACDAVEVFEPWTAPLPDGTSVSKVYVKHGGSWIRAQSDISAVSGASRGDFWIEIEGKKQLAIATFDDNWDTAYVVTSKGEVERLQPSGGVRRLIPEWLKSRPGTIDARALQGMTGTFVWRFSFKDGEDWLTIMSGRAPVGALDGMTVTELIGVETQLWVHRPGREGAREEPVILANPYYRK